MSIKLLVQSEAIEVHAFDAVVFVFVTGWFKSKQPQSS